VLERPGLSSLGRSRAYKRINDMLKRHSYGWRPGVPDQRRYRFRVAKPIQLAASLDLRSQQPSVFDQGQLGSCTGNGIAAELEAQAMAQGVGPTPLSRLFIYYNERDMEGTIKSDAGADIVDGIKSVVNLGVCSEAEWPYDVAKFATRPDPLCYQDALKLRAILYESVDQDLTQIKTALTTGRGLVIGISVYDSFESDAVAASGIVPLPALSENMLGGHCVRLVGYTDVGLADIPAGHFIGMNSWGADWGLKGFFAIPYPYLLDPNMASDFWTITATS
jgi:C1A family cysteine protease